MISAILPILDSLLELINASLAPISFAVSEISATVFVFPDPEKTTMRSSALIAGVMVSPTTNEENPRCISRMANAFATSPDLPAPIT
ncbi:MAG: hypothetical protein A4E42_02006 [Methanoregulaceae archaeon PtaU1.Bin222]|nr:MAG: hypothetical protein A4E42_02006 [Methanoregulaceae archaeon PtaU1.Bin222]